MFKRVTADSGNSQKKLSKNLSKKKKFFTNVWVWDNNHNVSIFSKIIDKGGKFAISHFHRSKLSSRFWATQFELFDDVTDFLESVYICEKNL